MVEDRAQAVLRVVAGGRVLDGLADRHAQRAGAVGVLGQDGPAVVRRRAGAGHDRGAVRLHQDPPVRLLVVAGPDHVDLDFEVEQGAGERQGAAPLAGPGLGCDPLRAFLLVVEGLRDRGVRLVAAGRAAALVLVVDVGGGVEDLLQPVGPEQRAGPIQAVGLADRPGDLDLALGADLLADQGHREERGEVGRADRLAGPGVEDRCRRDRQVRHDVVPGSRDLVFREQELGVPVVAARVAHLGRSPGLVSRRRQSWGWSIRPGAPRNAGRPPPAYRGAPPGGDGPPPPLRSGCSGRRFASGE